MALYILGNGFSKSLKHTLINENYIKSDLIDLTNLFAKGDNFSINNTDGFLSSDKCDALHCLGVSSKLEASTAIETINNIVTSFNVYSLWRNNNIDSVYRPGIGNIYIQAYNELNDYLKCLFIYYNSLISDDMLLSLINKKKIPLLNHISKSLKNSDSIKIVTYNYDVFLERLLSLSEIKFNLIGFNYDPNISVSIYKPHGSINFKYKHNIGDLYERLNAEINELCIKNTLRLKETFGTLVAPSGSAIIYNKGWTNYIRTKIEQIRVSPSSEQVIIFGHSYGEIDRPEIDNILIRIPASAPISYINTNPSQTLVFILKTIFDNITVDKKLCEEKNETNL